MENIEFFFSRDFIWALFWNFKYEHKNTHIAMILVRIIFVMRSHSFYGFKFDNDKHFSVLKSKLEKQSKWMRLCLCEDVDGGSWTEMGKNVVTKSKPFIHHLRFKIKPSPLHSHLLLLLLFSSFSSHLLLFSWFTPTTHILSHMDRHFNNAKQTQPKMWNYKKHRNLFPHAHEISVSLLYVFYS